MPDNNPSTPKAARTHRFSRSSRTPLLRLPPAREANANNRTSTIASAMRAGCEKNAAIPPQPRMARPVYTPTLTTTSPTRLTGGITSRPPSEPVDDAPVALRGLAFPLPFEIRHRLALFGELLPGFAARVGLAVKRLRHRGRPAHLAEPQHLYFERAAVVLHA